MHNTRLHIYGIFTLLMLLVIGTVNEASAKEIRYHILTRPFSIRNYNNSDNYLTDIRVEALLVKSDATTVGLPEQYKSPLATNFQYYTGWETPEYKFLFDRAKNTHVLQVKYYIYSQNGGLGYEVDEGADVGAVTDIYVTYDYNPVNEIYLDKSQDYNISVGGNKFLCYNRSRNNRIANANSAAITGEHLASTEFVVPTAGTGANQLGFNWSNDQYAGAKGVHMGFWLTPTPAAYALPDPYNITLMTAYDGDETYQKDPVESKYYVKPYKGATLFAKIVSNANNNGTESKMWFDCDNDLHYKGVPGSEGINDPNSDNYWEKQVDYWPGYFRNANQPLLNSVAILNHPSGTGYVFVASKLNQGVNNNAYKEYAPNSSGNYATLTADNNDPKMYFKTLASSPVINIYKIRSYTYKIKTHGASPQTFTADMRWSDAKLSENIVNQIPESLRRKYCSYKAYSDAALTKDKEITTFADAKDLTPVDGKIVIWLDYTVSESLPFETLPADGSYENAHWYTMRVNGKAEAKNIAYKASASSNLITSPTTGDNSNLHTGENSAEAMVAFVGDPYELRIINRAACEAAPAGNRYVGCATSATDGTTLTTNNSGTGDISTWEIMYESTDMDNFVLRQFGTYSNPKYIGWDTTGEKPVIYSATSTRIRVVDLDKVNYTYHIMRADHSIAIKATVSEYVGKSLKSWTDIPSIIRSPFLATATVTYYATSANAEAETPAITHAPFGNDRDIYVRYSFVTPPSGGDFNVSLNSEYIYTSSSYDDIYSKSSINATEAESTPFAWTLDYSDPYAMTIWNKEKSQYVQITSQADNTSLQWVSTPGDATRFIAKQSGANVGSIYEVMLATGDDVDAGDGTGITTTYYNIGRHTSSTTGNTVKLFSNATYATGYSVLQFMLTSTTANEITYHLIDKAGKDLLQVRTRQTSTDAPSFPPQYRSPLVSAYHYYDESQFTVSGDVHTLKASPTPLLAVGSYGHIYVTYDVNDEVNMKGTQLYLLKYEAGEEFHQENGGDGVDTEAKKAIYPYCNGDCNFFVYGQEQYDLQQQGAASTRTRWAWSVQSDNQDPYHVKIVSRQTETFNSRENNAYFSTYQPDGYDKVVTTLTWPGIYSGNGVAPVTEYMVLGNSGQYQLVTTDEISGSRYAVNSFEQYWKTFDTIRKKIYGDNISNSAADPEDPDVVPNDVLQTKNAPEGSKTLRAYLQQDLGWHSYERWAYAKRWDGCNAADPPATSKGWEKIEHWFQTVSMGEGYFDFVETKIDPVLILLDQHGWEVMRKPLPSSPDDPEKNAKYDAIRPYNSPMVKEYAFWATAKKRTGLHQYYQIKDRIGGDDFTSTDLTSLPPYESKNVKDKKGNLNDQYVTYIVKDEYAQSYNPETGDGAEFLIEQGSSKQFATTDGTTLTTTTIDDIQEHLLNETIPEGEIWYVKPNAHIDFEIGYGTVSHSWGSNPNAYETEDYRNLRTATYINDATLGQFSFSNGFDPYNIQIAPKSASTTFMQTNATGAQLDEGVMHGIYGANAAISLAAIPNPIPVDRTNNSVWFDNVHLAMTNATFMAVQDADGNMQLMPRFDQDHVMSEFGTLVLPNASEAAATTHTTLYRAERYDYRIIDNDGHEALRYKSGGDLLPQTPDHFKSPLAKDFTYFASATQTDGVYSNLTDTIKGSLDGATLTGNIVYVRYAYDEDADPLRILRGNWLTMQINEKDAKYNSGISLVATGKPAPVDGAEEKKTWQWKFLEDTNSQPDPYCVYLFNRNQTAGTKANENRFAILSHTNEGGYALAQAGLGNYTYNFLSGSSSTASIATVSTFKNSDGTFTGKTSQVLLYDDVQHDFKYKVYTNGGVFAIDANQDFYDVTYHNDWKPVLPEEARTPLLDIEQFRYYEKNLEGPIAPADTAGLALSYLYGLYDDVVYTHYTPYVDSESDYLVPNVRNATSETTVARSSSSNDAALGLDGIRPYNFIWYADDMMKSNGTAIAADPDKVLQAEGAYEWELWGNDPYAIQIKNAGTGKFIHEANATTTELNETATPFMLIPRDGYQYGVLAKTGNKDVMLSGHGNTLVNNGSDPNHFIIFALSTYKVIYHLMIKNIGDKIIIPYRATATDAVANTHIKDGTTLRDLQSRDVTGSVETHIHGDKYQLGATLTAIGQKESHTTGLYARDSIYCYDAGHVSLGDVLKVPSAFYRPNVNYDFYIEGVYTPAGAPVTDMNNKYQGLKTDNMGDDGGLLDNVVFVNIVYSFMGGLDTNAGDGFVTSVSQNKWYTFEANDATPRLAEYTGNIGSQLITQAGYATHYTNDYLWTPVGDPYGFKMYNRYGTRNGQEVVMTTSDISAGRVVTMSADNAYAVYELLATSTTTPGYFHVHPMVNMTGLQYYVNSNSGTGAMTLSTTPSEWTFGLSEEVMNPYYQAAGYVGGLTAEGKAKYEEAKAKEDAFTMLMGMQAVVYNDDYIVPYTPGYYRLHSQPGSLGLSTPRYASGYTHKTELTAGDGGTAIPLHFYEQTSYSIANPVFTDLEAGGYTETVATQGDMPLQTVGSDPASIFYFYEGAADNPTSRIQTQGLYVKQNVMTKTEDEATAYQVIDIGGAIVALYNSTDNKFLCYNQETKQYDLKYDVYPSMESARWCMQPVQKGAKAGNGEMGLSITTNNGKDGYYYATFYAPFDVLLTDASKDIAYVCPEWDNTLSDVKTSGSITPENIGKYNTAEYGCPESYRGSNQFIPANTPVIIRTSSANASVTAAIPTLPPATPRTSIKSVLTGQYLEQMLPHGADYVYVFGLPYSGTITEDDNFATNGIITAMVPQPATEVGFYKNMNYDRESNERADLWTRNNKYVLGNKIYYRDSGSSGDSGSSARELTRGIGFRPVVFDVSEEREALEGSGETVNGDGCIYDMQGRMVADGQMVADGTWRQRLAPGVYIVNGRKFVKK
ncbi:MAG: hypothetical protein IJV38_04205 [Prevotella sp.]|nr:hypothetical protein [Prevotella sp.]